MVDGAARIQTLVYAVFPVAIPGIVAATVFSFLSSWDHLLYALAFVSNSTNRVLPAGVIVELVRGDAFYWSSLMAGAVLASVRWLGGLFFLLHYPVAELTGGATKY